MFLLIPLLGQAMLVFVAATVKLQLHHVYTYTMQYTQRSNFQYILQKTVYKSISGAY